MRIPDLSWLRRLLRHERGNALMITAIALPMLVGAVGIGVHSIQLTLTKRQLQREADSGALAGAYSLKQSQSNSTAEAAATEALTQNPLVTGATPTVTATGSFTVGGNTFSRTMYVRLTHEEPTAFMALFGLHSSIVAAEARAAVVPGGTFCFFAKEPGTTTGIIFGGNSTIDLDCGVATNSQNSTQAIRRNGNPTVTASPLVARGGIESGFSGTMMPNQDELTDPFGSMSLDPSTSDVSNSACKTGSTWKTITVASGATLDMSSTHGGCYGTIDVQGTLTLGSGVYYLANGANNAGLQVGAQGHLTCDQCAFVLTSTTPGNTNSHATMNINGSAEIDLTPPQSGTYDGITIYRDRRAALSNQCCTINGNSASTLSGAFYFPSDTLTFNGTSGMILSCFQMVALRLTFTGTADITNTCTDKPGGEDKWKLSTVRLIS